MLTSFVLHILILFTLLYLGCCAGHTFVSLNLFLNSVGSTMGSLLTKRGRLSWLTNSALVNEPMSGGGGVAGSQQISTAVHMKPR